MPNEFLDSSISSPWGTRIHNAVLHRKKWEDEYKTNTLENYYRGKQWRHKRDFPAINYNPYTINLFYATIKIKLATFLFQKPRFTLSPTPGTSHWDLETAVRSSQLKQDTLNTIICNPHIKFAKHLKLAAIESFFRFGLVEVGYAADWRNPQKEDPYLNSWDDKDITESKERVISNNEVPVNERFYVKRINTKRFLVPKSEETDLEDHDWCGYSQWYYTSALKKTPGIKFPDTFDTGIYSGDYISYSGVVDSEIDRDRLFMADGNICRCYHIFDMIAKKRRLLLDDGQFTEIWSQEQERLPLIDIRWDFELAGFYPIPPAFQWLSPQDEINESREQARSHRRRFTAKYAVMKGGMEEEEKEKFASGPDGVIVEEKTQGALRAVDPPNIGNANGSELILSKEDFNTITGTSAEARPGGDRETATKSQIADQRAKIRESADQIDFSEYVCLIGREILAQAQEKLSVGLWVKYSTHPGETDIMTDMQVNAPIYQFVSAQDLSDGYDFSIEIDVNNATPAAMQQQEAAFVKFIQLLTQFPMLAMSPILIREAAYRVGYKNEQVIHQVQQAAVLQMAARAAEKAGQQGQTLGQAVDNYQRTNPPAEVKNAQMEQPDLGTIGNQITNQLQ